MGDDSDSYEFASSYPSADDSQVGHLQQTRLGITQKRLQKSFVKTYRSSLILEKSVLDNEVIWALMQAPFAQ